MEVLNKQEIINQAAQIEEITPAKLAILFDFTDEEIEFVKLFWEPAFNKSWIYLTKEMVVEWMGYKDGKSTMSDFYTKNLIKNYEDKVDYKEVKKDDEIFKSFCSLNLGSKNNQVKQESEESFCSENFRSKNNQAKETRGGSNSKHYIITGECLKCLLMSAQTPKGKIVRKIYIKTERLAITMFEVMKQKQISLLELEKEKALLEMEKDKASMLYELEEAKKLLEVEMDDVFWNKIVNENNLKLNKYIAKFPGIYTGSYEKQNKEEIYTNKAGMTTSSRQSQFNTSSSPNNPFLFDHYKIFHGLEPITERYIHRLLEPLNIKNIVNGRQEGSKEQFMIPKIWLNYFVDKVTSYTNELAEEVNEVIDIIEKNNRNYDKANVEIEAMFEEVEQAEEQEKEDPEEIVKELEDIQTPEQEQTNEEIKTITAEVTFQPQSAPEFINDEHKALVDKLEHLKNDIIKDIFIAGQKSFICKIKTPNSHKAPESHYTKTPGGQVNHYCIGCKNKKPAIEELEKQIKEFTHRRCSDCGHQKLLMEFSLKTESTYYSSCNVCLGRRSRSISKKEALMQKFNNINKTDLNKGELLKIAYLIKTLDNSTKESLKNKKQINELGKYKRCNLTLSHYDNELLRWKLFNEFGEKDFRCKGCRTLQNKKN